MLRKRLKALSIIEISIALIVIGLVTATAVQGWKWVESSRIAAMANQIVQLQAAVQNYKNAHGNLPVNETFWDNLQAYGGPNATSKLSGPLTRVDDGVEFKATETQRKQLENMIAGKVMYDADRQVMKIVIE